MLQLPRVSPDVLLRIRHFCPIRQPLARWDAGRELARGENAGAEMRGSGGGLLLNRFGVVVQFEAPELALEPTRALAPLL